MRVWLYFIEGTYLFLGEASLSRILLGFADQFQDEGFLEYRFLVLINMFSYMQSGLDCMA